MFWKTFFITFIFQNKKYIKFTKLDATHNFLNSDKIPIKRKNFEKTNSSNDNRSGYDNRFNESESNTHTILNIVKIHKQMQLIKILENKNISENLKIDSISNYTKVFMPLPIVPNIFGGGLLNDWNSEII